MSTDRTTPAKKVIQPGDRFTRLTVIGLAPNESGRTDKRFFCQCDCGKINPVRRQGLLSGTTKSCGCLRKDRWAKRIYKHGMSNTQLHCKWNRMKSRCSNPTDANYHRYGGRGIRVCERWQHSFEAFVEDMGPMPTPKHTLERKDNDKGYSPENCVWATMKEQLRNTHRAEFVTINGVTKNATDWRELTGLSRGGYQKRIEGGWPRELALLTPPLSPGAPKPYVGAYI